MPGRFGVAGAERTSRSAARLRGTWRALAPSRRRTRGRHGSKASRDDDGGVGESSNLPTFVEEIPGAVGAFDAARSSGSPRRWMTSERREVASTKETRVRAAKREERERWRRVTMRGCRGAEGASEVRERHRGRVRELGMTPEWRKAAAAGEGAGGKTRCEGEKRDERVEAEDGARGEARRGRVSRPGGGRVSRPAEDASRDPAEDASRDPAGTRLATRRRTRLATRRRTRLATERAAE